VIRPAAAEDLGGIERIHTHYVLQTPATFDLEPLGAEGWGAKWEAAGAAGHPWFVLEDEGAVRGFALTGTFNSKAAYRSTVETTIYLDPASMGRGAGRPLYEALLAEAGRRDFHRATAGNALPNGASVRLHEAVGFTRVGVFTEVGHKLGEWRDVGWWERAL